jgi:hypothetical protein
VWVGRPVGVCEAVAEPLAEGDGLDDPEPDGVDGNELGVAGAVAVEEGTAEAEGTGGAGGGAGLALRRRAYQHRLGGWWCRRERDPGGNRRDAPTAPAPSSTGVHEEA